MPVAKNEVRDNVRDEWQGFDSGSHRTRIHKPITINYLWMNEYNGKCICYWK